MIRLRIVPYVSSGIEERAKRERAWKSPHARKGDTRRGERKMRSLRRVSPFLAWGDFHARSRFARSTIPEEKWGTTRSLFPKARATEQNGPSLLSFQWSVACNDFSDAWRYVFVLARKRGTSFNWKKRAFRLSWVARSLRQTFIVDVFIFMQGERKLWYQIA